MPTLLFKLTRYLSGLSYLIFLEKSTKLESGSEQIQGTLSFQPKNPSSKENKSQLSESNKQPEVERRDEISEFTFFKNLNQI